jgi:hypothetical protein
MNLGYVRIYAGPDGRSHFEDVPVELSELPTRPVWTSEPIPATEFAFSYSDAGLEYRTEQRPTSFRHLVIVLQGGVELEASDGEVRWFGPGSPHGQIVLLDDVEGDGHINRGVVPDPRTTVMITLP